MDKNWNDSWNEDIDFLRDNLIKKHKKLFFNTSKEAFEEKVILLKSQINDLDFYEIKVELSRLVASIKDAHTSVAFYISKYLPFRFYFNDDGIYIIDAKLGYENLLYKKVDKIEDTSIDEVLEKLSKVVSYENEYFLKAQSMRYLQAVDILYGLLICDDIHSVKMTIEGEEVDIETFEGKDLVYVKQENLPLHRQRDKENYWFKYLGDEETLYVKYNFCREQEGLSIEEKINETIEFINKNNIKRLTIDISNNFGGDSTLINPLIEYIKGNRDINVKPNLKLIIGRDTFSSALLNAYQFKWETNCIIIGEPSGGKPNCYGEVLRFTLPNSKFSVSYSTIYYKLIDDDNLMALYPDM